MSEVLQALARHSMLGSILEVLDRDLGGYELLEHWQQGEFHHDLVVRLRARPGGLAGDVLVIATNCNGGVKELLCLTSVPDRWALWRRRCPDVPAFTGEPVPVVAEVRTPHWFDPCLLLGADARSELKPGCRRPAFGGGWEPA